MTASSPGFHGFEVAVPTAAVSLDARRARVSWLRRRLADPGVAVTTDTAQTTDSIDTGQGAR